LLRWLAVIAALPSLTTAFAAAGVIASLGRRRGSRWRRLLRRWRGLGLLRRRWLLRGWRRLGLLRRRPTLPVTIATATAFATALVVVALLC
jgi:hypothetical protein